MTYGDAYAGIGVVGDPNKTHVEALERGQKEPKQKITRLVDATSKEPFERTIEGFVYACTLPSLTKEENGDASKYRGSFASHDSMTFPSYHFNDPLETKSYILFRGSKTYFKNGVYSKKSRTFEGSVEWQWEGSIYGKTWSSTWNFVLTFTKDLNEINSGYVTQHDPNTSKTIKFDLPIKPKQYAKHKIVKTKHTLVELNEVVYIKYWTPLLQNLERIDQIEEKAVRVRVISPSYEYYNYD